MDEQKLVPKLRFPGFTDPWEQCKLGEIVNIERGGSPRPIDNYITADADGLNWIKIGDAPEQGRYIVHAAEKIKPSGLSKTRQVEPGDLILSNSMSFGKPYIMGIPGCIHDGWLLIRNNQNIFDLKFLCNLLGTDQIHAQYRRLAAGSAVNNLNKELVSGTNVGVPSKAEQLKIGQFFESMDEYITLHQRKLEHLKLKKKSLLQKLFPKEGELYPELRFPGFTDPWEQRKLGEMFDERNEKGEQGELLSVTIGAGVVRTEDLERAVNTSDDRYNYKVVKKGDLIYNTMRMWQGACGSSLYTGIVSPAYTVLVPLAGNSSKFFAHYFKRKDLLYLFKRYSQGLTSDTWNLKFNVLKEIKICVPLIEEQYKIADFLEAYDSNLTLHQRKLEHLQLLKKALLQQLFV